MLSIRDFNVTQLSQNCRPKQSCLMSCNPDCSSDQICVYKIVTECGTCPPSHCIDNTQLQISATDFRSNSESTDKRTALIAGLTTGLVVVALIAVTIVGFVFYKRRKIQKQQQVDEKNDCFYNQPSTPHSIIPVPAMALLPPISELPIPPIPTSATLTNNHHWDQQAGEYVNYNHPQSPFIIGAQSLQIPHLDDTPDPSTATMRRSLNIQPTTTTATLFENHNSGTLGRASSVKVTKYDNRRFIPTSNNNNNNNNTCEDLDDEKAITIRRAVSVKKNNSTASHSSSITRVGSVSSSSEENVKVICAKPTMVRINTIIKREEGGITRKTSVRTIIDQPSPFHVSLHDPPSSTTSISANNDDDSGRIDFYFCPPLPPPPPPTEESSSGSSTTTTTNNSSQVSIQSSTSSQSTLGDGEITVFWEPPSSSP